MAVGLKTNFFVTILPAQVAQSLERLLADRKVESSKHSLAHCPLLTKYRVPLHRRNVRLRYEQ